MSNNFSQLVFDKTITKSKLSLDKAHTFNADETLKHSKIQDEFVNIASHEIKTPIQSILTYSELLHSNPNEIHQEYIEAIYRNALRLQRLSKNLLDVTKMENHTFTLQNEKFDINELILSTIQDFVTRAHNSGIKTRNVQFLFSPKGRILAYADKDRIAQVISNLIDNAFKFTQRGNISTNVTKQNDRIIVSVSDSGIGINSQIASRLFSKFVTSSENGIGLGLYIAKNIVEAHDGKIWFQNNPNRIGATISFEIPSKIRTNYLANHQVLQ
ncbi:sensor histidine kinase [Candidatus Nitrosotalea okcheonensis]|uniref:histidine kinase n=1 Tax=Candidatus Nitrosotalea okcheonensis TaxID=1903276 RepID=A0A2H1FFB0_9ARCH